MPIHYADRHCMVTEEQQDGQHYYVFTGPCRQTGKPYSVRVPAQELYAYRQGAYIQDALRSVSTDDREFLMSGLSPEGWQQVFGRGDEDDADDED